MHFVSIAITIISLSVLSGCISPAERVAMNAEREALEKRLDESTPICIDEKDCNAKWEMSQLWVNKNASYKIQTSNNVVIETYNSQNRGIAVSVTKEPLGGGRYKIVAKVWCKYWADGCMPDSIDATFDFNRTVSAVTP